MRSRKGPEEHQQDPIAPAARIRRDSDALAKFRGECDSSLERLARFLEVRDVSQAKAAADSLLPGFCARLFKSPYYRGMLAAAGLSPSDLRSVDDLPAFPLLDRETLGARWRDLPVLEPGDPRADEGVVVMSSGSTGTPIRVFRDGYELLHMWTMLRFWAAALGIRLPERLKAALLDTLPGGLEYESEIPVLPGKGELRRISTRRKKPLERLLEFAPHAVFSDPAGLLWLMAARPRLNPLIVLSSAQYLPPGLKEEVEKCFGAPVVDYYAITETGPIAWACPEKQRCFHVLSPDVWAESVGGEIVVTKLRPSALPLLRYRTGDQGEVSFGCGCGFAGFVITGFSGRSACDFTTASGKKVDAWQLAWLFKHHALDDFRLEQTGPESFSLELVGMDPGGEACFALSEMLRKALSALGFQRPELTVARADALKASGRKPRPFGSCWTAGTPSS